MRSSYKATAKSGQLSQILKSKNSPISTQSKRKVGVAGGLSSKHYSPYGQQVTPDSHRKYRNDGLQSCESCNDSPEQTVRGEELGEVTRVKARGSIRAGDTLSKILYEKHSHIPAGQKAISVQSADRSDTEDLMDGNHMMQPAQSTKQLLDTNHLHILPSLKVCIGGVPTLKQASTQKTAQKSEIIDSILECDRSSKASYT